MRVFNLAEELEKERKKNKELESKLKATNKVLNDMDDIAGEYEDRIDKAIEYINENWGHWCSNHCKYATETINILKGDNK